MSITLITRMGQVIDRVGTIRGLYLDNIHVRHAGSMGCSITGCPAILSRIYG